MILVVIVVEKIGLNICLVVFFVVMMFGLFSWWVLKFVCLFIIIVLLIIILRVMIKVNSEIILMVIFVRYISVMVVNIEIGMFIVI